MDFREKTYGLAREKLKNQVGTCLSHQKQNHVDPQVSPEGNFVFRERFVC